MNDRTGANGPQKLKNVNICNQHEKKSKKRYDCCPSCGRFIPDNRILKKKEKVSNKSSRIQAILLQRKPVEARFSNSRNKIVGEEFVERTMCLRTHPGPR